jgi:hypothetical protein
MVCHSGPDINKVFQGENPLNLLSGVLPKMTSVFTDVPEQEIGTNLTAHSAKHLHSLEQRHGVGSLDYQEAS